MAAWKIRDNHRGSAKQHVLSVDRLCPNFRRIMWRNNRVQWVGKVKPTLLSCEYTIRIELECFSGPNRRGRVKIVVISPQLRKHNNQKIPHLYPDGSLCLFYPSNREWDSTQLVAETIIPWISLWLYFYEIWLITGEWKGGGIHSNGKKDN